MPAGMMRSTKAIEAHIEARKFNQAAEEARVTAAFRRSQRRQNFQRHTVSVQLTPNDKAKVSWHRRAGEFNIGRRAC